ncbi:FAD-dependent oxidoreductase [Roseovarius sp. EL26]|uniref:FAD-dependent oxidoreductase n=1 Tax=Roseovarius sp. EL26 TaxID=2126672 RepID=UPI0013C4B819|nr:FAD-dependent oxidoreductase [Roseovarius sp. EL26]
MKIAIIGGGLTGCISALEFADRGHSVVIFDQEKELLTRASTANEGKIHLGYVYAADKGFNTAVRLIDDALMFRAILERWMPAKEFEACLFDTFDYFVPRDSKVSVEEIKHHFKRVETQVRERKQHLNLTYLGQAETPDFEINHSSSAPDAACFTTQERGLWPFGIARAVRRCVSAHPRIETMMESRIKRTEHRAGKWQILFEDPERQPDGPFNVVVNAAWADRRNIDRRSGFPSAEQWFTRFKFGVLLENASHYFGDELPKNATATSGSYGDSVYYEQNDSLYCSWYPVGMCFSSTEDIIGGRPCLETRSEDLSRKTWGGYSTIDPTYKKLENAIEFPVKTKLIGDFIMARGQTDISDPSSMLHQRYDHGPSELSKGYWSIETGKYTSTARCAVQCVEAILEGA